MVYSVERLVERLVVKSAKFLLILMGLELTGCAILHSYQIGEIDSSVVKRGRKIELLISETGISFEEAGHVAKLMTSHAKTVQSIGHIQEIIALFQMGPRTGNPVFRDSFADNLTDKILEKCNHGKISGLTCVRETAKYPIVSGEIVKVVGYCYDKE